MVKFHPESGPGEGGTLLEIRGRDLGSRLSDVQDRVLVAGVKCRVVGYEISTRITCIVAKGVGSGPVRITIGQAGRRTVESKAHYRFVDPQPKTIYPQFGPQSGGTRVVIHGDNLHAGRNISVHLDNLPCEVVRGGEETGKEGQITCLTTASPRPYTITAIRVQVDSAVRLLHGAKFTYRTDPVVTSIQPAVAFESGGRVLTITGSNFDSLLTAKIYLLFTDPQTTEMVSHLGQCQIINATAMSCLSPKLRLPSEQAERTSYGRWPVGFVMDGVEGVRNLGRRLQLATVPNPQFQPFTGVKLHQIDQPLVIHGTHLSQAADVEDYEVTIGTAVCRVFVVDSGQLLCHPPTDQEPAAVDDKGVEMPDGHPLVVVRVGGVRAEIGPVELVGYSGSLVWGMRISLLKLLLLIFAALSLLVFVGTLLLWLWRRRGSEHERVYKRIQLQMEQMESNVRNECKLAFAELQTDVMSDLHTSLDDHLAGIPFRERADFITRLLFPNDNPLHHHHTTATVYSAGSSADGRICGNGGIYATHGGHMPVAMGQFEQLLRNKQFIFLLVQMVEGDSGVTPQERTTLSSLLVASLCKDMVYLSEVVLALLSAHIEQAVIVSWGSSWNMILRKLTHNKL